MTNWVLKIIAWGTLAFLVLPIFVVFPLSFSASQYLEFPPSGFSLQWYENYFATSKWTDATLMSFQIALGTTVVALLLGTAAAFGLVRGKYPGKGALTAFFMTPIIIPYIITAIAIYFLFSRLGIIGNPFGLMMAHSLLAIPKVLLIVAGSLKGFDETLERASMSLGAGRFTTLYRVTYPVIRPSVVTAGLFAFLTSFDELIITMFIAGTESVTLPKRMWDSVRLEIDPTIAAASSIVIFVAVLIFVSTEFLRRRGGTSRLPIT